MITLEVVARACVSIASSLVHRDGGEIGVREEGKWPIGARLCKLSPFSFESCLSPVALYHDVAPAVIALTSDGTEACLAHTYCIFAIFPFLSVEALHMARSPFRASLACISVLSV